MTPPPATPAQQHAEVATHQSPAEVRLRAARQRAAPVVEALLRSIQQDPPLRLDAAVIKARRELDLLWQAVGRVTEP